MKEKFIDSNGTPQVKFIVDSIKDTISLDEEVLTKIVTRCADETKSADQCESSFNFLYCYTNDETIKKITQTQKDKTEL